MLIRIFVILVTLFSTANVWAARSIQADGGNDSFHLGFFSTFFAGSYGALALSPDVIFKSEGQGVFAPGVYWYVEPENNSFFQELAFGVRGYLAEFKVHDEDTDVEAVAFGMMARSRPLSLNWPFFLAGGIHYAPDGTTFGDGENLLAWTAALEYELLSQVFVYVGYRDIAADTYAKSDATIDETGFVGLRLAF